MRLSTPTRLGPYEVLALLGAGAMGEVYRARDVRLNRDVAIKVLAPHLANDPDARTRFEREAKAVAALSHPSILAIHDVGTERGVFFTVTELLEGETLRSRVARAALPWRRALEIGVAIADGLSAAHAKGIVHRDLKPENIFLTADGRVKILDFGLARLNLAIAGQAQTQIPTVDAETRPGMVMGTPGYMSPEQVRGAQADARSDIFSLGCVLYEMLTGKAPFARETGIDTLAALVRDEPPELADAAPTVPAELGHVIGHCLEKRQEQRFQSARDLAVTLRAMLSGGGSSPSPGRLAARRWRPVLWVAAGLVALALGVASLSLFRARGEAIESLAVLPFVNASADPNAEYLSDGITESLINSLSQVPRLRVVARTTAFTYKGRKGDPLQVGRDLNVRAVLTGRVAQRNNALVIQADLVDVARGSQLWGQQYNRTMSDIFTVQEEISREISEKLRLRLSGAEEKRLTKRHTENTEAYQLYLTGRYHWNKRTDDGLRNAITYFERAIEEDPAYAEAYAGLADAYALLALAEALPPREAMPKARAAAIKALAIDDQLAEPHTSLAWARFVFDWDWIGAERDFKRAIDLNPNYETAHHWYAIFLTAMGRRHEAIAEITRARELDPLSLIINSNVGWVFYRARQYDRAIEHFRRTLELDPNFLRAHVYLGDAYEQQSMYPEALAEFQTSTRLEGGSPDIAAALGAAYAAGGMRGYWRKRLDLAKQQSKQAPVSPYRMAGFHARLGEKDQAFEWLEQAYQERSSPLVYLNVEPVLDSLRSDPRFRDLLRRLNLTP